MSNLFVLAHSGLKQRRHLCMHISTEFEKLIRRDFVTTCTGLGLCMCARFSESSFSSLPVAFPPESFSGFLASACGCLVVGLSRCCQCSHVSPGGSGWRRVASSVSGLAFHVKEKSLTHVIECPHDNM